LEKGEATLTVRTVFDEGLGAPLASSIETFDLKTGASSERLMVGDRDAPLFDVDVLEFGKDVVNGFVGQLGDAGKGLVSLLERLPSASDLVDKIPSPADVIASIIHDPAGAVVSILEFPENTLDAVLGHAVRAREVATIGHRHAQVGDRAREANAQRVAGRERALEPDRRSCIHHHGQERASQGRHTLVA
jgi:hypothetical protein